jgi:RNA polymerase sigma factor (sigma-70 family)
MPKHSDEKILALIKRIIERDQRALAELYTLYSRLVFNLALYILQNRPLAEEITQDVFFDVWRNPERWNPKQGKFSSWLMMRTRFAAINHLRGEQNQPEREPVQLERISRLITSKSLIDDPKWDDGRLLRALLKQLPKEQVQVIFLAYFRGMSHTEIAKHLKLPEGTVKSRIRLGLQKLRDLWYDTVREMDS